MSCPRELSEYMLDQLIGEILRRKQNHEEGRCPYCGWPVGHRDGHDCRLGKNPNYYNQDALSTLMMGKEEVAIP